MKTVKWYTVSAVLILGLCWYLSKHYFQLMLIQGDSMNPSYRHMQIVVLDKREQQFQPLDVVVFRCDGLSSILVKRIVAVPGDTVVVENKTLLINGEKSAFYEQGEFDMPGILCQELHLSDGEYIVIGDNVKESKDSRDIRVGIISVDDIIGKVQ